jgi:hypothetical protein
MSRGMGRIERHVRNRIAVGGDQHLGGWFEECGYVSIYMLAWSLREAEPTRSELVSVRRAVRKLQARRLIEVRGRSNLMARLRVADAQREAEKDEICRRRKEHSAMFLQR